MRVLVLAAGLLLAHSSGAGQQPLDPSYRAPQLDCARFFETARSTIRTVSGRRTRDQTSGRTATWRFRASPADKGVSLEGWLDSLALWRRSSETVVRPDTDGLIGGRYRGVLGRQGSYTSEVQPFVPPEVGEVARMGAALEDFFPPLPPRLQPGASWTDSAGLTIRRLADSGLSGVPLYRFALKSRQVSRGASLPGDTIQLELEQVTEEEGRFVWHPTMGLLRRERNIVVETDVPAGGAVRQPVRSRIEQRITVERDLLAGPGTAARDRTAGGSGRPAPGLPRPGEECR